MLGIVKTTAALLTSALLVSCQTKADADAPAPAEARAAEPVIAAEVDVTKPETLIGQPLEKVQAACDAAEVAHRVVEVDGVSRPVTRDYRPERLNFKVADGKITAVTKG
jgi:hypothetical protein